MKVKEVAIQVLLDAKVYLDKISPESYRKQLDILFGASIGQHTRHFMEFFQCLLDQIDHVHPEIDYALRARDLSLESDPSAASRCIDALHARFNALTGNIECRLVCTEHFEQDDKVCVSSSLERELIYNIEHTIHHLAIIKIGLATIVPEISLPAHFGVAPSTVKYKQGVCAQ